jgi:hypothetical protein
MLQLSGFVFEEAGLTSSPRTSPGLPTNWMTDDPSCHRLLSRWITQSDLMFLNRISVSRLFFTIQIGVDFSSGNFTAVFELGGHVAIISKQQ